jgi:hypothetical protein
MRKDQVTAILAGLNEAKVRYLVAGGLAVVAHGYVRYTNDIDLVLSMDRANLLRAVEFLEARGYHPLVPVPLRDLADDEKRRSWIEEKNAMVLNLVGEKMDDVAVDVFLQFPYNFETEWNRAESKMINDKLKAPIIALETLIEMKIAAKRPRDQDDLLQLRRIRLLREKEDERNY